MSDVVKIDSHIFYDIKKDIIINLWDKSTINPFDRNWVNGNMIELNEKIHIFYLDSISCRTVEVLPYKLEYMGFKNFEIKKTRLRVPPFLTEPANVLYIKDDSEYAYFRLLMNDFISNDTRKIKISKKSLENLQK